VTIISEEKYPFQITGTKAEKGKYVQVELEPATRKNRAAYVLTIKNTKQTQGRYTDRIRLFTDSKIQPEISIFVRGEIKEAVEKGGNSRK
jgi:hypothetical protein